MVDATDKITTERIASHKQKLKSPPNSRVMDATTDFTKQSDRSPHDGVWSTGHEKSPCFQARHRSPSIEAKTLS